jgi:hypothetical protein
MELKQMADEGIPDEELKDMAKDVSTDINRESAVKIKPPSEKERVEALLRSSGRKLAEGTKQDVIYFRNRLVREVRDPRNRAHVHSFMNRLLKAPQYVGKGVGAVSTGMTKLQHGMEEFEKEGRKLTGTKKARRHGKRGKKRVKKDDSGWGAVSWD